MITTRGPGRAGAFGSFELTPRAAAIVERLLDGVTVVQALQEGAAAAGVALDDDLLAGMTHLFADLSERGVILGAPAA